MEDDAGPSRLSSRDAATPGGGASRRRRRQWLCAIATVLTLLAGGIAVSGYLALHAHRKIQAISDADAAAVAAAKDCVAATQPADVAALPASQHKLDECATGEFGTQATWY